MTRPTQLARFRSLAVLATTVAGSAPAAGEIPKLFDTSWLGWDASNYQSARYVYAGTVADFDQDGDTDVATTTYPNIPRVTVLFNNGDGTYAQPDIYLISDASYEVIAADIDGDTFADLVAANTNVNFFGTSISLLHNNGDGTFAPAQEFTTGQGPVGLAAADFDGDGHLDIAVAEWGFFGDGATVSLLRGDGSGGFLPRQTFDAGASPFRLDAADLNGDDLPDLAVANGDFNTGYAAVNILFNDGAGGFEPPVNLPMAGFSGIVFFPTIRATDIDRDQDTDLLFSHTGLTQGGNSGVIALFRNLGGGAFAAPVGLSLTPFAGGTTGIDVGDMTGDGWPDIAGSNHDNEGWTLLPSAGGGTFGPARRYPTGEAPWDVHIADADGDGDLDPIVFNRDSLEVCVHENPGDGDFEPPAAFSIEPFSRFFDHGDIDSDGDLDIAAAGAIISILRNQGDGTFAAYEQYFPPLTPLDLKLRDLDGDGDLDLLFNEDGIFTFFWATALNDGTGHFDAGTIWGPSTCGYFKAEIDAFDLDSDDDLDVVRVENLGCPGEPFSSRRLFVHENLGNANFVLANIIVLNPSPRSLAAGDFNEDGVLDLVVNGQPTSILLGHGDFTFTLLSAADLTGINVAAADLDGDDHLDIVQALQRGGGFLESMAVQLGHGDGSFQPETIYLGSHAPNLAQITEVLTGDPDNDGDIDVMASNYASNDASFWANHGDGTFAPQVRYGVGLNPIDLSYADFTGDGVGDLAGTISSFPPLSGNVAIVPGTAGILGDLDGDGVVGITDLLLLLAAWGPCPDPCPPSCLGDLNADCAVGITDLLILLANWG
jgi:hypothetical protein